MRRNEQKSETYGLSIDIIGSISLFTDKLSLHVELFNDLYVALLCAKNGTDCVISVAQNTP